MCECALQQLYIATTANRGFTPLYYTYSCVCRTRYTRVQLYYVVATPCLKIIVGEGCVIILSVIVPVLQWYWHWYSSTCEVNVTGTEGTRSARRAGKLLFFPGNLLFYLSIYQMIYRFTGYLSVSSNLGIPSSNL